MIDRMPKIGEKLVYQHNNGDITYTVHSHCRMPGILNIQNEATGEITQIIAEFKKGEFNKRLSFEDKEAKS